MSYRGTGSFRNGKKNTREQRLEFMNSQAELIAQKKREIEEKLAKQQVVAEAKPQTTVKEEVRTAPASVTDDHMSPVKSTPLPFKNDGSFLEQFKLLQQQKQEQQQQLNVKQEVSGTASSSSSPQVYDPPHSAVASTSAPPPNCYLPQQYPPPSSYHSAPPSYTSVPPPPPIKEEVKPGGRSPSPYSPSRPCEDDEDNEERHTFFKDYHHGRPGPSNSAEQFGSSAQSLDLKRKFKEEPPNSEQLKASERERKRQSRWGPQEAKADSAIAPAFAGASTSKNQTVLSQSAVLSRITTADPQILQYAFRVFGTTDLTEDQWKQCMDQVKMQYVYQEMLRKKQERERLEMAGKVRYEYDSDEEVEGGTWEHKRRQAEMDKTKQWADRLTENGRGKHHLSHFLPPEELAKFMEKFQAVQQGRTVDESDYKEFKIAESNVGYQMLKKFGWSEGQGLGAEGSGIVNPVNATRRNEAQGLGAERPEEPTSNDDEFDAYRKRMMLAYRFRPNPLNNPRRSYY